MVGIQVKFRGSTSWLDKEDYTLEQQAELFDQNIEDVLQNTRWYLDNLNLLAEYRVCWGDYRRGSATKPYRLTKKGRQKHTSL